MTIITEGTAFHEHRPHHRLLDRVRPRDRQPTSSSRDGTSSRRCASPEASTLPDVRPAPRAAARRDRCGQHRRCEWTEAGAIDVLVNNAGHRLAQYRGRHLRWRSVREDLRDQHLLDRRDDAGGASGHARPARGRDRQCQLQHDPQAAPALLSIYRASKAAVNALTEAAALELMRSSAFSRTRGRCRGRRPEPSFSAISATGQVAWRNGGFSGCQCRLCARQTMAAMQQHAGSG